MLLKSDKKIKMFIVRIVTENSSLARLLTVQQVQQCYVNSLENIINFFPPNSNSLSSQPEKCVGIIFYVPSRVGYGNFTLHEIPNVQYWCVNGADTNWRRKQ